MKNYVLLTGATGLVGRYLLRDLLLEGHSVAVAVRPSRSESAADRIEGMLLFWEAQLGKPIPRPAIIAGDLTESYLGLSDLAVQWLERHCDRILHNAAALTFYGADRAGEPWRTNITGTEHVLGLCARAGIREFHYVSTAYVCGTRNDVVYEHELDTSQTFRNDYEHSKFLAEKLVRDAGFIRDLTVYRPAVIAGDSRTGYTCTYHGLLAYLKLMSVICRNVTPGADGVRYTPIRMHMTGDERRNVVPVDWVSEVIGRIFKTPELHGRTYHLAPREPITPRQVIDAGYKYFNSRGVEWIGPAASDATPGSSLDQVVKDNMTIYESYDATDPQFDTTNLQRYLPDLPCPKIDEAMLHLYWRYGEEDRWGKRRWKKPARCGLTKSRSARLRRK